MWRVGRECSYQIQSAFYPHDRVEKSILGQQVDMGKE